VVGAVHVIRPEAAGSYEADLTGRFAGRCSAVVRPADAGEVSEVVAILHAEGWPLVVQGGRTGLVGGAVPLAGQVALSLDRMTEIQEIDETTREVTVGAGATLAAIAERAHGHGLDYAIDHGGRSAATIGGTIATNAGGPRALRYGVARHHLRGVQAVLADGTLIDRTQNVQKDATGYDFAHLLCGSEGTLGIVTAATVRLIPRWHTRATALLAFESLETLMDSVGLLRRRLPELEAAELMTDAGINLVCAHRNLSPPFSHRARGALLIEVASDDDALATLVEVVGEFTGDREAIVAHDSYDRARLWQYREALPEAIRSLGMAEKFDVCLPMRGVAAFIAEAESVVHEADLGSRVFTWAHAGDGNIHLNVTGWTRPRGVLEGLVYSLVKQADGSIGAEHGVGRAKAPWLSWSRSEAEIQSMRTIKKALDPGCLLNRGVLFPDSAADTDELLTRLHAHRSRGA